jgi:hypothetical protein
MKNVKKSKQVAPPQPLKVVGISRRGKKVLLAGILVLIIGYLVLTKTDPAGQNLASKLSPFLILGGYALVGIGIVFPEKAASSPSRS